MGDNGRVAAFKRRVEKSLNLSDEALPEDIADPIRAAREQSNATHWADRREPLTEEQRSAHAPHIQTSWDQEDEREVRRVPRYPASAESLEKLESMVKAEPDPPVTVEVFTPMEIDCFAQEYGVDPRVARMIANMIYELEVRRLKL